VALDESLAPSVLDDGWRIELDDAGLSAHGPDSNRNESRLAAHFHIDHLDLIGAASV
jgi:hypothetical protein